MSARSFRAKQTGWDLVIPGLCQDVSMDAGSIGHVQMSETELLTAPQALFSTRVSVMV